MTGHGGNEFLKFQDNEEISAFDIADAFEQMYQKKRYNEIFFMIDTCQANSMYSKFYSPNILATGSSRVGENSYSYENDNDIGVAVIDSYTHFVLEYMERINKTSHHTMSDLFATYDPAKIHSHPGVRSDLFRRPLADTLITDFFGGVAHVEVGGRPQQHESPQQHEPQQQHPPPQEQQRPPPPPQEQQQPPLRAVGAVLDVDIATEPAKQVRARAWGAVGVLAVLVGWAGTRR
ncbi:glycosylphosphatidylinositol anchor biosynthesis [Termitomyces sp. T159_Od127]|nr:glycosylphosphatidylinositol anchor biosynthesis [Termitomyces sp. T159_Od127]